ncbi:ion transporter [Glycomyces luteolus]|uniref:Ion transporter n=1 Tax=Glycomyces luteolus TaxID=2670330 RepID=A0A9X3SSI4_9ACTN|nr:ion transporter [Glycomyces luteolus]MDA1359308.1 ion transporter [Glycomyces luteolus]
MRVPTLGTDPSRVPAACRALLANPRFQMVSMVVILVNAAALGAMTFPHSAEVAEFLHWVDYVCLGFFAFEVLAGLVSFGRRPLRFFKDGWNIFDFVIVFASFMPGLRENVTILRMLRLARIVRIFRSLPSLRIILVAAGKALPKSAGVFALTGVVMYLWAMVGWIAFSSSDSEHFGTVGKALLNLFQLVAFDDMGNVMRNSMAHNMWTLPYYLVFILFGAFVLVNLLLGVVLASMEEAQRLDDIDDQISADTAIILERIDKLQNTVDKLQADQERGRSFTPFQ